MYVSSVPAHTHMLYCLAFQNRHLEKENVYFEVTWIFEFT